MKAIRTAVTCLALVFATTPTFAQGGEEVVYFHADAIGSVRLVTDANGQVVERYDYLPFGEPYPPSAPAVETRRFGGKERDTETGLDYFGGRYYASANGRFTTVDPMLDIDQALVNPQLWNRYAYAVNNPLKFTDPDGRNPVLVGGGIGAAVYAAWNAYLNVQHGRPWYENVGVEASKGFLIGATLGLAAPALAGTTTAEAIATASLTTAGSTASTFGFARVEGVIEGFTHGRLANGADVAARFSLSGNTLTTSVLGAFNAEGANAAGTLRAIMQGAQAVAKDQGARQLVIQAVGVVNQRLADILVRQGFRLTTVRIGKETVEAYERVFEVYR